MVGKIDGSVTYMPNSLDMPTPCLSPLQDLQEQEGCMHRDA